MLQADKVISYSYLQYLRYFCDPRYARFLQYPSSLEHLSLLTAPDPAGQLFRTTLRDQPLMVQEWAGKMVARWAGWRERDVVTTGKLAAGADEDGQQRKDGAQNGEASGSGA